MVTLPWAIRHWWKSWSPGLSLKERQKIACFRMMMVRPCSAETLCPARRHHVLVPFWSSDSSYRCPPPGRCRLFARSAHTHYHPTHLCSCDRQHLSAGGDESHGRPIGLVKGKRWSSENPTSRSCRVREARAAYGAQDAALMGVNHLQPTIRSG